MTKKLIILSHLRGLDGNGLEHFKKALCELKPPPGTGPIRMENIENKSIEEIVDFIFKCHTDRHGASTIKKVLKEISENQIRLSIERELRNCAKSKSTEGIPVSNIAPTNVLPTCVDVPCSEPASKKLKRDQDGDAVPGASQHKEATASKSEGHRPAPSPLTKESEPQVDLKKGNFKTNLFPSASTIPFGILYANASSKKSKPQLNLIQDNVTSNISYTAPTKNWVVVSSNVSKEPNLHVNPIQGNRSSKSYRPLSNQFGVASSHASSKKPKPQVNPIQGDIASNISHTGLSKQMGIVPSYAFKGPEPQVNSIQGNITSNISHTAPSKQLGVAPPKAFKEPEPQVKPIQRNIASNIPLTSPSKQLGVAPSNAFKEPEPQVNPIQSNIASNIPLTAPNKQLGVAPSNAYKDPEPQVKPILSNIASNLSLASPSKQLGVTPSNAFKEPEPQVKPIQRNIASNLSLTSPSEQLEVAPSKAFKEAEPQVKPIQSNITSNLSLTSPSKQLGVAPSSAFKEPEPQVNPIQSNIASNISLTSPSKQLGVAPSNAYKEPEPQVKPIQSNITSNISLTSPSKQLGVAPSSAFKEPEPQVNPIQSNITSNIPLTSPSKQLGVAPSNAFKEPEPQVKPIQSNYTSNISLTSPSKQLGVAPSNAFKEPKPEPQVKSIQSNITSNLSLTAPSKQFGVAPSNAFKEHSQTEKSLPNTSVEKKTRDILAIHLKTLGEAGIETFKEFLCLIKPPLKGGKIQTRHVKEKSVEDMVDLIIRCHTIRHARATVRKVLTNMKENNLKMLIEKDFRKSSSRSNLNMLKQNIIIKVLENLDAESLEEFKNALCSINPPRGCEQMTMNNLKDKSLEDIIKFILKFYTQRYGPEIIRDALKRIGKDKIWKMIQNNLKEGAKQERKMENEKKKGIVRFVKHHALDLIREVALVDPILDDLMSQKLITRDQYDKLCSNTTPQKKMRELYKFVSGWSDGSKVTFYDSLLKHNKKLIKYLEHQDKLYKEHFVDRHQQEVIKGMTSMIELILSYLRKERLLKKDQFQKISTEATPEEKMEMLYHYIKTWDIKQKDIFYDILKKCNGQIISLLEEKGKKKTLKPNFSKHFVDRHRQDLINWVYVLQPILDSLLKQNLLSKEQYESICSNIHSQEKIKDLYNEVRGWGYSEKDTLYNSLGNHNRLLIRDLEYQDMEWPLPSRSFSMSLNQSKWTHKHLLLYTLEYLLLEELKHFTKKLSNLTYKDRPTMQFGMLENEDSTSLSDKLINHYGEFTALDVTNQVLKSIGLNRFAVELQDGIHLCGLRRPEVILTFIMDELEQVDFRLFKDKLFERHKEDKQPIPKRLLDCADRITTTDLLIWIYGEKEAMLVTVQILWKLYSLERSKKVERLTRDLENWIVTQGIAKQDFREGEVAASKVTDESFAPQPGRSKDFDFQVLEKANPDPSEPNSASQTGSKHQVSSKEENTQSCRMICDLKNEIKCSVCLEVFGDPTTLMCGHSFCMKCIEKSWNSQPQGKYTCPNCKHKFEDRPQLKVNCALRDVAIIIKPKLSKPKNREMICTYCTETPVDAVKSCLLCEALLCNNHLNVHSKEEEHILIEPTTSFKERKCSIHKKVLEHYCTEDDVCVCSSCCIYGEHRGHQVEKVTEAAEKKKNDLINVQKELTCKEKNIEELLKCRSDAQMASDTELFHKLLEVLELKVPGDTSIQEGWALFSVPDLIQKAEKMKSQLSHKIDNIQRCQETDPILFLQDQKKELFNKSFQCQTVDVSETLPKEASNSSSCVDDVDRDLCEKGDDPEKMHLTSSFSERFQSNEDVLDMSTGGCVSSFFEGRNNDDTLNSYPGESLQSIDLDNLSEENYVSSSDSDKVDWSPFEEDNDSDENLSRSMESLQSQGHALNLSEESSISSHLDEVDCNLCGKDYDPDDILIAPEINGNSYKLKLTSAGLFRCSKTGIKFQVRYPVTMEYELESWYDYMEFLRYQGSEVAGPLFNIKTPQEPDIVSAVYLPHYVCLKELSEGTSRIICAHFKDGNWSVEKPARILPFHVVLENPSFSPLGTLWHYLPDMVTKHIPIHGKVLLYFRVVGKNHVQYQIHLYLVPIFTTMSQDLEKSKENNGFEKIDKPSRTTSRIYTEKKFIVRGSTITHVMPTELEMLSISPLDNFLDIIINAPVDMIKLCLVQKDSEENVWGFFMSTGEIEMSTIPKCKRLKEEMDMEDEQQRQPSKKAKQVSPQLSRRERLLNTLQEITQKKFEEFKKCLMDKEFLIRNQYNSMMTSELENKDRTEVSELLIRRYTKEQALPITILVLDRIGEKELAKNLRPYLDAKT